MVPLRIKLGLAVLTLLGGYLLWVAVLRDLSLFQVERVSVNGLSGDASPQIETALELTAREMTTTDFSTARLRESVAAYASVANITAQTQFPHGVKIDVVERRPLARVDVAGRLLAVSANDRVLAGLVPSSSLPLIRTVAQPVGDRITDRRTRAELTILDAAPAPLLARVFQIRQGPEGLTVRLRHGPLIFFGSDVLPHAKWDSAAAVLASTTARGARYVDVALPGRPAAGVDDPLTNPASGTGAGTSASVATLVATGSSSTSG